MGKIKDYKRAPTPRENYKCDGTTCGFYLGLDDIDYLNMMVLTGKFPSKSAALRRAIELLKAEGACK